MATVKEMRTRIGSVKSTQKITKALQMVAAAKLRRAQQAAEAARPYARGMAVKEDEPGVLFAGCGETTTGETGFVLRTKNFGENWEVLRLPTQPNATMWGLATHPAEANRIVAFSLFGEVYVTEDAGDSWRKIAREFGEIRSAIWVPN